MKGQTFAVGEPVRICNMQGFQFNGRTGTVVGVVQGRVIDEGCTPYKIEIEGSAMGVLTCACHIERMEPAVTREWYQTVPWAMCRWRPHVGQLSKATHQKLIEQIKVARRRRGEIK